MANFLKIGPIQIGDIEQLSWSTRKVNEIVSIPFGPTFTYSLGVELIGFKISGAVYQENSTVPPKVLRKQLTDMCANYTWELTYLQFDEDSAELNGWFILDSFSTGIVPGTFHYSFQLEARRLVLDGGMATALYAEDDNPLTTNYNLTPQRWMAMPNGHSAVNRPGHDGITEIVIDNPNFYVPYDHTNTIYDYRCSVHDTTVKGSSLTNEIVTPSQETDYEEYFGLGNNFKGDVYISNGLIRCVYRQRIGSTFGQRGRYYWDIWTGSQWERAAYTTEPLYGGGLLLRDAPVPPIITYLDEYRVEFIQWYHTANNPTSVAIKNIMRFGAYFVEKSTTPRNEKLDTLTILSWDGSGTAIDVDIVTANYASVAHTLPGGSSCNLGLLFTDAPDTITTFAGSGFVIADLALTDGTVGNTVTWAVFIVPNPAPTGATNTVLGLEFLSNSNQRKIIVNPKWI